MLHSVGHMPDYALLASPHMKIHSGFDGLNALLDAHETRERVDCIGSVPFLILYLPVFLAGHSRDFAEVAVRRRRSFGEIDGPQRRRERFSVLVNCQGVKRMLVRDSDAGVEDRMIGFSKNRTSLRTADRAPCPRLPKIRYRWPANIKQLLAERGVGLSGG
jgi:hypothetical protein